MRYFLTRTTEIALFTTSLLHPFPQSISDEVYARNYFFSTSCRSISSKKFLNSTWQARLFRSFAQIQTADSLPAIVLFGMCVCHISQTSFFYQQAQWQKCKNFSLLNPSRKKTKYHSSRWGMLFQACLQSMLLREFGEFLAHLKIEIALLKKQTFLLVTRATLFILVYRGIKEWHDTFNFFPL